MWQVSRGVPEEHAHRWDGVAPQQGFGWRRCAMLVRTCQCVIWWWHVFRRWVAVRVVRVRCALREGPVRVKGQGREKPSPDAQANKTQQLRQLNFFIAPLHRCCVKSHGHAVASRIRLPLLPLNVHAASRAGSKAPQDCRLANAVASGWTASGANADVTLAFAR